MAEQTTWDVPADKDPNERVLVKVRIKKAGHRKGDLVWMSRGEAAKLGPYGTVLRTVDDNPTAEEDCGDPDEGWSPASRAFRDVTAGNYETVDLEVDPDSVPHPATGYSAVSAAPAEEAQPEADASQGEAVTDDAWPTPPSDATE